MDLTFVLNHIGYVFCFWGVWKALDVTWNLLRVDMVINSLLQRDSDMERQFAGKLSYFNKLRETDEKKTQKALSDLAASVVSLSKKLTPDMDENLRSTIYGLYERLKLATDGLKFDHELAKEVEKLRKKIHELNKAVGEPPPCFLPLNPLAVEFVEQEGVLVEKDAKKAEKKTATKRTRKKAATAAINSLVNHNPYIPQSLTMVKGGYVPKAQTNLQPGSLGEKVRYADPHQVMLDNLKEEEAQLLVGSPKSLSTNGRKSSLRKA
jgi:hypothetical protein